MLLCKIRAVIDELNVEIAEREELIECIFIALLTKINVFILGRTGQAKSHVINEIRKRIVGAKQFERLLSKQTDEDVLFGRIDLKSLLNGIPKMITTGKIPDAHIVFLDEIFKSNDAVLNSLLTVLNERRYTNEGEVIDIPAISFMAASNEIPNFNNADEQILRPLYDRFELKIVTQYIKDRDNRLRLLERKQRGESGQIASTITLDDLYTIQKEVASVSVPASINELMDDILCDLRGLGIHVSDRKFLNYYPMAQAKAWLNGRSTIEPADLSVMQFYFWTTEEDIPVIRKVLDKYCLSPLQVEIKEIISLADESYNEFNTNIAAGATATSSMIKLREELKRVYRMVNKPLSNSINETDEAAIKKAFDELEEISKIAHNRAGFDYVPLKLL